METQLSNFDGGLEILFVDQGGDGDVRRRLWRSEISLVLNIL